MALIYYTKEPARSKFLVPFLGSMGTAILCAHKIITATIFVVDPIRLRTPVTPKRDFFISYDANMIIQELIAMPLILTAVVAFCAQICWYYVMKNRYQFILETKEPLQAIPTEQSSYQFVSTDQIVSTEKTTTKLERLKRITSKRVLAIISVMAFSFFVCFNFFIRVAGLRGQLPESETLQIIYYFDLSVKLGAGVLIVLIYLIDILKNARVLFGRCEWRQFFYDYDPLRFRLEMSLVVLILVLGITSQGIASMCYFKNCVIRDRLIVAISSLIPLFMYHILFLIATAGIATVQSHLYSRNEHIDSERGLRIYDDNDNELMESLKPYDVEESNSELVRLLNDVKGRMVIDIYSRTEFTSEYLLYWYDLSDIRRSYRHLSAEKQLLVMKELFDKYLADDALYKLRNFDRSAIAVEEIIEDRAGSVERQLDVLDALNSEALKSLIGIYSRLKHTGMYRDYQSTKYDVQ
jgi:hypothetical protein